MTLVEKMDFDEKQMIRKIAMREKFECTKSECTKIPPKYVNPNVRKSEIGQKKFWTSEKSECTKTDTNIEPILKMCEKLNGFENARKILPMLGD